MTKRDVAAYHADWYQDNKEKVDAYQRAWRAANRAWVNARMRKYRQIKQQREKEENL